jgi:hypothetical protein
VSCSDCSVVHFVVNQLLILYSPFCSLVKQYTQYNTIQKRVTMIGSMKNFHFYQRFAYHISLLRQFVSLHAQNNNNNNSRGGGNDAVPSSVHGNNVWNSLKMKRGLGASVHSKDGSGHGNTEILGLSMGMGGMRRIVTATGSLSTMLHEGGEQRKV